MEEAGFSESDLEANIGSVTYWLLTLGIENYASVFSSVK